MSASVCHDVGVTLVIAHRGASAAEPENTVAAFERAVEIGADAVELDVRRSADDRLVVHHDAVLADGRPICSVPAGELPDEVPTLDDALDACRGIVVNIEIKNSRDEPDYDRSDWLAWQVGALLARRGGGARWLVSSFRLRTVERCRKVAPGIRTAWLTERLDAEVIRRAAGHDAIHPRVDLVTRDRLRLAHAHGLAVNVWTCNDPERMRELIAWGVDGICTDLPDVALAVRAGTRQLYS